ncbi:MAG: hypothetical protein SOW25_07895, partial [Helicobacter sp.]|nr:hypothetical protein [Helicobacter sp.]
EAKLEKLTLDNFNNKDSAFCLNAGIYELDKSIKHFKRILNIALDKIIEDAPLDIDTLLNLES